MKINTQIETQLNKIPNEIKKIYNIDKYQGTKKIHQGIMVYQPSSINIMFDKRFEVYSNDISTTIKNNKVSVTLWKTVINIHITVY